jgi:hypothetical protein
MKEARAVVTIVIATATLAACTAASSDPRASAPATENKKQDTTVTTYSGTLRTGIMAIGGETTGVLLETTAGTFELDLRQNADANAKAESLDGKKVVVTGEYRPRAGVEVKERRIVIVRSLQPAK